MDQIITEAGKAIFKHPVTGNMITLMISLGSAEIKKRRLFTKGIQKEIQTVLGQAFRKLENDESTYVYSAQMQNPASNKDFWQQLEKMLKDTHESGKP